jgi:hypothetical protein
VNTPDNYVTLSVTIRADEPGFLYIFWLTILYEGLDHIPCNDVIGINFAGVFNWVLATETIDYQCVLLGLHYVSYVVIQGAYVGNGVGITSGASG